MEIRAATADDIEAFKSFIRLAWGEAGPGAPGWTGASDERVEQLTSDEFLSSLFGRADVRVLLAWDDDEIVGFASNRRVDDETVELSGIVVLESMTGRGIGSQLLEAAVKAAVTDGFGKMVVKTESFNERAIGFYESRGFEVKDRTVTEVEGVEVELVELRLLLSS